MKRRCVQQENILTMPLPPRPAETPPRPAVASASGTMKRQKVGDVEFFFV